MSDGSSGAPPGDALRSIEAAALAGLAHAGLSLAGNLLLFRPPSPDDGGVVVANWYLDGVNQRWTLVGINLIVMGAIAFMWFVAVIRRRVGERESRFFGTVFLGSALVLVGCWLIAAVFLAGPAVGAYLFDVPVDVSDVAVWRGAGVLTASVVATRLEAVFIISTTTVARLSEALPRPMVVTGYVVGFTLLLAPVPNAALVFVFPAWVATLSVVMLLRRRLLETGSAE